MLQLRFVGQDKPPVWLVENHYVLGSDSACTLLLTGNGVQPRHAELRVAGEQLTVTPLVRGAALAVDGLLVSQPTPLLHNSRLTLGEVQLQVVDPKKQKTVAESDPTPQEWHLVSTTTALANRHFPIRDVAVVGRSAECDISLGVAHLSRRHARLWVEGEQLWVEDLGSSNGTYVNNLRVGRALLKNGDLLGLDTLVFSVAGGPAGLPSDGYKTSLRPALSPVREPELSTPDASPPATRTRPAEVKPKPPQSSESVHQHSPASANWILWAGLAFVGFLTLIAIIYLLS